ncbi:hypothetical protein SUGI_0710510 [Cryptomeria japonica]|nr:hypothetical protein SUGI_0710510 [Cryptomeria japonica]
MSEEERNSFVRKWTSSVKNNVENNVLLSSISPLDWISERDSGEGFRNDAPANRTVSHGKVKLALLRRRGTHQSRYAANRTVCERKVKLALLRRRGAHQSRCAVKTDFDDTVVERKMGNSSGVAECENDGAAVQSNAEAVQSNSRNLNIQSLCETCYVLKRRNIHPIPFHCCVEDTVTLGFRGPSPFGPIERPCKSDVKFES